MYAKGSTVGLRVLTDLYRFHPGSYTLVAVGPPTEFRSSSIYVPLGVSSS